MDLPIIVNHEEKISGLLEIKLDKFSDNRGTNFEGYNKNTYKSFGFPVYDFPVDSFSASRFGSLRGFHGDSKNWKMIQCVSGKIQFRAVDLREKSGTHNGVFEKTLEGDLPIQILLPPGVVNAHLCLSDRCAFFYKLSIGYAEQNSQLHLKWNDPRFGFHWEISNPILSKRDS